MGTESLSWPCSEGGENRSALDMRLIENILSLESRGVLSLVGGGGKTSIMFHLARLLAQSGKRVLTTTTTKIFLPAADQSETVLVDTDPERILRQVANYATATVGHSVIDGKLIGFAPGVIHVFMESGLFDWILVEADGSARRPLKAHAGHEPVIPSNTTVLITVAGLEVLGEPLSEELVFRSELAGPLMGLAAGETITETALAHLFSHPLGAFKGAPSQARRFIFLNKADDSVRRESGAQIAAELRQSACTVAEAVVVGQALDMFRIHAVHPLAVPV